MTADICERTTLKNKLKGGALDRFDHLSFRNPLGDWPVVEKISSPRRFEAFIFGIATAAREINIDWFIDSDVGSWRIPNAVMVMAGQEPAVKIPVKFSRKAVQIGRVTVPLTAPHAGELILETVLDAVIDALPVA